MIHRLSLALVRGVALAAAVTTAEAAPARAAATVVNPGAPYRECHASTTVELRTG